MALFVRYRPWMKFVLFLLTVAAIVFGMSLLRARPNINPRAPESFEPVPSSEPPGPVDTPPPSPPVPIATVLAASDAQLKAYDGRTVEATSVNVLSRPGPTVAWIGNTPADRVLLVLVATTGPFKFSPGAHLTFTGTVRRAAPGAGKDFEMSAADSAELDRQGAYVEVELYTVT